MPRQNRVTPFGEIIAVPERGTVMGNRGRLHDDVGRVRRPWQVERWLLCRLEFNGRHRTIMDPRRYTELFFLDEATGLAAGHRPCFECRRASFHAFANAWAAGNADVLGPARPTAATIDGRLHAERVGPGRSKRTFTARRRPRCPTACSWPWRAPPTSSSGNTSSPGPRRGYTGRRPRPRGEAVSVLTPRSTVAAIRAGYGPEVHPSAFEPRGTA